jgi:Zn-dependent metalloprotease
VARDQEISSEERTQLISKLLRTILLGALALMLGAQPFAARAQTLPGRTPSPQSGEALLVSRLAGNGATIARHPETGRVSFIGATQARPIGRPAGVPAGASPDAVARGFMQSYGKLFGIENPSSELRSVRTNSADRGRSSVRFQQLYKGVPVVAGELMVNLDASGNVLSANGETAPAAGLSVVPRVTAASARQTALTRVAKEYRLRAGGLAVSKPSLWIYDNRLLGGPGLGVPRLVWRMDVTGGDLGAVRELVLVDAQRGVVALNFNQVPDAKQRYVCNKNNVVGAPDTCLTAADGYVRTEGQPATGNTDVDRAYDYAGQTYDYFWSRFGRNSLDNKGLALRSTVKYCPDSSNCPFVNAYWNGQQMVYGDGFASADDVVGHELSHGVTEFTSGLFYYYQSGAINESLSDVFGEYADLTYNTATDDDSAGVRWYLGEDLPDGVFSPGGELRDMKDPTRFGDPDRMGSPNYYSGTSDSGGVHTNSGVNNKAAYLMVDGGTFNGRTVTGLGLTKAGRIYYEAEANILTAGSDYNDMYWALKQACSQLIGVAGITSANCTEVNDALLAVQMNGQPTTGIIHPEAPTCPAGQLPTDLFSDNFENPSSGNWTRQTGAGTNQWVHDTGYQTSGKYMLYTPDQATTSDTSIARTAGVAIPTGKQTYMRFRHAYEFEGLSSFWDGGVIEYSTNNGATWQDAGSLFKSSTDWGYQGTISSGFDNPLGGRQGYGGSSDGFFSSRMTLTELAGQTVHFRFRVGTDSSGGALGWIIDDLRIYTCGSRPAPSTINKLKNPDFENDDDNNSLPDSWTADQSALRMPTVKKTGSYSLRHKAVDNQPYAVSQIVGGLTAGTSYTFWGWVNIPTTTQAVNFTLEVQWRNSAGGVIGTTNIKTYTAHTGGAWNGANKVMVAPTGTTSAKVRMVQRGLGAVVYTDSLLFRQ